MSTIYYEVEDYGDDFLMHHGIKGMKWGIRRTAEQLGHYAKKAGKAVYKTAQKGYEVGKKGYGVAKNIREKRIEKAKNKAILRGDYKEIMKYREKMTDEEFKRAYTRMDTQKKLDQAKEADTIEKGIRTLETIARVGKAASQISTSMHVMRENKKKSYDQRREISEKRKEAAERRAENSKEMKETFFGVGDKLMSSSDKLYKDWFKKKGLG